jgi:hypothetical protein
MIALAAMWLWACGGEGSDGSSGGGGGAGGAGGGGGAGGDGGAGAGPGAGGSSGGESASCVMGSKDVHTVLSEALTSFSIGSAFYAGNDDGSNAILLLNAQSFACGDPRMACLGWITCNIRNDTPPPTGTYDATGAAGANPGGIAVSCRASVHFADCSAAATSAEPAAGSTLTLTTVGDGRLAGSVSLDFASGTFAGDFDAARWTCMSPTPCAP